jgi:catechol 2,3-dioxygenase-like lactoylglutathione lyase family enzyme
MSITESTSETASEIRKPSRTDMKLEIVVIPVSDVDRAKRFYDNLGWRLDIDFSKDEAFRVVQFTPPGSGCSVIFGRGITLAVPGTVRGLYLIVSDIEIARADLVNRGVAVREIFHDAGGVFHHASQESQVSGPAAGRRSYGSYASFDDPDGNGWFLQEVTARLPGHVDANQTIFTSANELSMVLRRAAAAHAGHEKRIGRRDAGWYDWYAEYIFREQTGKPLPS